MRFTDHLRVVCNDLWEKSFDHPFVRELAAGTLPESKFSHYVRNDAYYLTVFAKVQSYAATKSADLQTIGLFASHAQGTVNAELSLHETFFGILGIDKDEPFVPAPTAYQYTTHLLATAANGSLGDIVASILPCYWLYWEIGQRNRDAKPNHPIYDKWIAAYGGEWFGELVEEQIHLLDRLAEQASESERKRMEQLFLISSQYELEFWDMAYTLQSWRFQ